MVQNDIQKMHWHNFYISILVHNTYRQNPLFNPTTIESKRLKQMHYYVFDDLSKDTLFLQHAFMFHWHFFIDERIQSISPHSVVGWMLWAV
jgi:hypothetical protein